MRLIALTMCAVVSLTSCGGKTAPVAPPPDLSGPLVAAGPIVNSIAGAVPGLSEAQSALGAGSLLVLAQATMRPSQYAQVSTAIPGSDVLVVNALNHGLPSDLDELSDVTAFLQTWGISSGQVHQVIPVMGNALHGKVGPDAVTAFMSALR